MGADIRGSFVPFLAPSDLAWIVATGSSNVDAFRWWPVTVQSGDEYRQWLDRPTENGVLEVRFLSGRTRTYQYYPVPRSVYLGMLSAPSRGSYVQSVIRKGGYPFIPVA